MSAPRPWGRAAAWLLFLGPFFFATYGLATWLTMQRSQVGSVVFAWEHSVPFVPWTIVPYWAIDLIYGVSLFVCADRRELDTHAKRLLTAQVVAILAFLLFPLRFTFERPETGGAFGDLFLLLTAFDQPFNQAPSLHIALLVILWALFARKLRGVGRVSLDALFALIGAALTTWQHHFIDVPTGALLGFFCLWRWPQGQPAPLPTARWTDEPRRRRLPRAMPRERWQRRRWPFLRVAPRGGCCGLRWRLRSSRSTTPGWGRRGFRSAMDACRQRHTCSSHPTSRAPSSTRRHGRAPTPRSITLPMTSGLADADGRGARARRIYRDRRSHLRVAARSLWPRLCQSPRARPYVAGSRHARRGHRRDRAAAQGRAGGRLLRARGDAECNGGRVLARRHRTGSRCRGGARSGAGGPPSNRARRRASCPRCATMADPAAAA